ncbi:MAG: hypothetical protein CVV24_14175 [Ignavibacteriae bacterium HGW-Ignavibacteriae-3]|nr:MAG: hypothetical protein CVV24_14175 [Ignavibacteriae bacterium HGW-Ignavibacteriae-3]
MSANILFITQSKHTIDELQKINQEEGNPYKFFFAQTSHTALNIISDNVITAVAIDLSFAKFDSPGLLSILQYDFPNIFRLCIFSAKERQKFIGLSKYFHKTIKFPLIPKEVLKTISELVNLSNDQLDPVLIAKINELGTIPVLPDIYLRLEKEISSSNLSMNRVAEIIQTDR